MQTNLTIQDTGYLSTIFTESTGPGLSTSKSHQPPGVVIPRPHRGSFPQYHPAIYGLSTEKLLLNGNP